MAYESFEKGNSPWRAKLGAKNHNDVAFEKKENPPGGLNSERKKRAKKIEAQETRPGKGNKQTSKAISP